jgi:predicted acylesterase/phospholipase RssA
MDKHCLILAGGGARVFIQAGMLKEWLDNNPEPDIILGVSAGCILGSFFSQGKLELFYRQLCSITKDSLVYKFRPLDAFGKDAALLDPFPLRALLNAHIVPGEFKIPCYAVVTNWTTVNSEVKYLNPMTDNVVDWIMASASPAVAFPPYRKDGKVYGDGGCMDNFPLDFASNLGCNKITMMTGVAPEGSKFENALDALSAYIAANDFTQENIEKRLTYFFAHDDKDNLTIDFYGPTKSSGIGLLEFGKAGKQAARLFELGSDIIKQGPVQWLK